jgi:mannose-6-phosphate isomerase-like protein (cupin superfamily)
VNQDFDGGPTMTKIERVSAEPRWFGLNLTRVHVSNTDSQGGFVLIEMSGRRYDSPLHVHHHESETHYVLEGVLRIHIPGRSVELHPGDAFCTPRGVPQMYQVVSDKARWLLVMAPGGFDGLVATMSEPAERDEIPPGPHSGANAVPPAEALRAHGLETLGPPGTMPAGPAMPESR